MRIEWKSFDGKSEDLLFAYLGTELVGLARNWGIVSPLLTKEGRWGAFTDHDHEQTYHNTLEEAMKAIEGRVLGEVKA